MKAQYNNPHSIASRIQQSTNYSDYSIVYSEYPQSCTVASKRVFLSGHNSGVKSFPEFTWLIDPLHYVTLIPATPVNPVHLGLVTTAGPP